jgi:hypothetical protein
MIDNQMSLVTLQKIWPLNSLITWSSLPGTVWRIKRMVVERRCGQSLNGGCPLLLCWHFLCDRLCYGVQGMTIHSVPTKQYELKETISKKLVWKWSKNYVHKFWQVIAHIRFEKTRITPFCDYFWTQIIQGELFLFKFCGLLRIYQLYLH